MLLPTIYEISIVGVADPNVPNKERIIIRPTQTVNLGEFGISIGRMGSNNMVTPSADNFLWFGELIVEPPSWVVVYTGPGQFLESFIPENKQLAYIYHWGKKLTVFNEPNIVPVIFRLSSILSGQPQPYPSFPQLKS